MKQSKIAIIRRYSGYGGIERQIEIISHSLKQKEWEVLVITDVESPMTKALEDLGIECCIIPFGALISTAFRVKKQCNKREMTIIQSHMLWESFLCRLVKLMMPRIKHVFRVHTYIDCSHISRFKKNIYHFAAMVTDFLVDRYIVINQYNVKEMKKRTHLPERKIAVAHDALKRLDLGEAEFVSPKNGHIAMVANFVDFKGHDVLLDGLRILKERGYKLTAHLFGTVPGVGTDHEDPRRLNIVKDTIRKYGLEEFAVIHGYSDNVARDTKDCGMIVLPSDSEGTPNVLLEGMALHKIVVASEVGGVPEFVIEGKTGFLHKPQDPEGFAEAIIRVLNMEDDDLIRITEEACSMVNQQFSIKSLTDGLTVQYEELMGER